MLIILALKLPSQCNNVSTKLPSCHSTKLLGVVIDSQLSFKNHIDHLLAKLAPKLGLLRRLSCVLPENVLSSLYMSIIQPHIDYCLSVWGSCIQTDINAIQKLQNRAAPIIKRCYDYNVRSSDHIKQLVGCQLIKDIIIFLCLIILNVYINLVPIL